jgi:hypothetical protein
LNSTGGCGETPAGAGARKFGLRRGRALSRLGGRRLFRGRHRSLPDPNLVQHLARGARNGPLLLGGPTRLPLRFHLRHLTPQRLKLARHRRILLGKLVSDRMPLFVRKVGDRLLAQLAAVRDCMQMNIGKRSQILYTENIVRVQLVNRLRRASVRALRRTFPVSFYAFAVRKRLSE